MDLEDWKIQVEKRLSDLEANILGAGQPHPDALSIEVLEMGAKIDAYIREQFLAHKEPVSWSQLSSRFYKDCKRAGTSLDCEMRWLQYVQKITVGNLKSGKRVAMPSDLLAEQDLGFKEAWGYLSEEEKAALEDLALTTQLGRTLREVAELEEDPDKAAQELIEKYKRGQG